MANPIKNAADEVALSNLLFGDFGLKAKKAEDSVENFNDVYFSSEFRARERLNANEYAKRRAKNKAAKKARRKNRGN